MPEAADPLAQAGEVLVQAEVTARGLAQWFEATPNWWIALAIGLGAYAFLLFLRWGVLGALAFLANRSRSPWAALVRDVAARTAPLLFVILAIYLGTRVIALPAGIEGFIRAVTLIALVVQAAIWISNFVFGLVAREAERQALQGSGDATLKNAISLVQFAVRVVVWSVAALMILSNLGVDVTALVAGLGIGGIAIGLAAQGIISDLFASLSIVLDKPFVTGDFIIFGDFMGTVERIGLKTTRIRALSGEQVVVANADLLATRIRNYKRMQERRIVFKVGVTYQTPPEALEKIPTILREAVEAQSPTRFDRSNFQSFGDFALMFETVYYVLSADYAIYMNIQEQINLDVYRRFVSENIEFAYPTQTVFVARDGTEPGKSPSPGH